MGEGANGSAGKKNAELPRSMDDVLMLGGPAQPYLKGYINSCEIILARYVCYHKSILLSPK